MKENMESWYERERKFCFRNSQTDKKIYSASYNIFLSWLVLFKRNLAENNIYSILFTPEVQSSQILYLE